MLKQLEKNFLLRTLYFNKTEIEKLLLLTCLFSIALCAIRIVYTGELLFLSLYWNLFLAFVPYAITKWLMLNIGWIQNTIKFVAVFILWLLFIPNSFYIITDLFHLQQNVGVPLWFDLALILSFAWNGLLLGILSTRQMEKMVTVKFSWMKEWFFIYPIMLLNAFGIYLGRYLRYNSWDVVSNPFQLLGDIFQLLIHPLRNTTEWSMIVCYAALLTLMYLMLKKISKSIW